MSYETRRDSTPLTASSPGRASHNPVMSTRYRSITAAVALAVGACGSAAPRVAQERRSAQESAVFEDTAPVALPALSWLPPDTPVVVVAGSAERLAREIGWDEVARRDPEAHARASRAVVERYGHDPFDLVSLSAVGLDPERPWGMALLEPFTLVFLLPLREPALFEQTVMSEAPRWNERVLVETVAGARVLGPGSPDAHDDWRIVLRDRMALWIVSAAGGSAGAVAQRMAMAGEDASARARFERAMEALGFGADVAGYAAAGTVLGPWAEQLGLQADTALAFGLDLAREEIHLRALVPASGGPLLHVLVRAPEQAPALSSALSRRPLGLVEVALDARAALELPAARALAAGLQAVAGLSLERDLAPILTGEIGVAVVPARGVDLWRVARGEPGTAEMGDALAVHALVELRDPGKARALLDQSLRVAPLSTQVRPRQAPGHFVIARPERADVHLGIAGRYLYISSEWLASTLPVLGRGDAGALREALGNADVAALLANPGRASAHASLDALLLGYLLLPARIDTATLDSGLDDDGYQPSEEYQRKQEELEAARHELHAMENAALAEDRRRTVALLEAMGTWALRVDRRSDALVIHGSQFLGPGGMPALLSAALEWLAGMDRAAGDTEQRMARARERAARLGQELVEIRRREQRRPADRGSAVASASAGDRAGKEREISGPLTLDTIRIIMRGTLGLVLECYERELAKDPALDARRVDTELRIGQDGRVTQVRVTGHAGLGACVEEVIRGLRFPAPAPHEKSVVVRYPFVFYPDR